MGNKISKPHKYMEKVLTTTLLLGMMSSQTIATGMESAYQDPVQRTSLMNSEFEVMQLEFEEIYNSTISQPTDVPDPLFENHYYSAFDSLTLNREGLLRVTVDLMKDLPEGFYGKTVVITFGTISKEEKEALGEIEPGHDHYGEDTIELTDDEYYSGQMLLFPGTYYIYKCEVKNDDYKLDIIDYPTAFRVDMWRTLDIYLSFKQNEEYAYLTPVDIDDFNEGNSGHDAAKEGFIQFIVDGVIEADINIDFSDEHGESYSITVASDGSEAIKSLYAGKYTISNISSGDIEVRAASGDSFTVLKDSVRSVMLYEHLPEVEDSNAGLFILLVAMNLIGVVFLLKRGKPMLDMLKNQDVQ